MNTSNKSNGEAHELFRIVKAFQAIRTNHAKSGVEKHKILYAKVFKHLATFLQKTSLTKRTFESLQHGKSLLSLIQNAEMLHLVPKRLFSTQNIILRDEEGICLVDWATWFEQLREIPTKLVSLEMLLTPHPKTYIGSSSIRTPLGFSIVQGYASQVPFLNEKWFMLQNEEREKIKQLTLQLHKESQEPDARSSYKSKVPADILSMVNQDWSHVEKNQWGKL